ncbi:hypothetical protein [Pseudoalteromonas sp. BDTF-M6]|uniref:hypothetical protein n=1 Tax=Pseudoalteromonas sp. BDTF-M6 TaxID=2796132 RepID=UPI001BB00F2B|nr:hypothetical protein [Pseudoalteromonas sp. BDTF-M6]MBS3796703.1 hypothetical protein [Pseudoalteromonas sp. BDTF-M6]
MTPEQENLLFQNIGQIQAGQTAILKQISSLKEDINARVDKLEDRVSTVEQQVSNNRVKMASVGGAAGLAVALVAEALKQGVLS